MFKHFRKRQHKKNKAEREQIKSLFVPFGGPGGVVRPAVGERGVGSHIFFEITPKLWSAHFQATRREASRRGEFTPKICCKSAARSRVASYHYIHLGHASGVDVWWHLGLQILMPLFTRQISWNMQWVGEAASRGEGRSSKNSDFAHPGNNKSDFPLFLSSSAHSLQQTWSACPPSSSTQRRSLWWQMRLWETNIMSPL